MHGSAAAHPFTHRLDLSTATDLAREGLGQPREAADVHKEHGGLQAAQAGQRGRGGRGGRRLAQPRVHPARDKGRQPRHEEGDDNEMKKRKKKKEEEEEKKKKEKEKEKKKKEEEEEEKKKKKMMMMMVMIMLAAQQVDSSAASNGRWRGEGGSIWEEDHQIFRFRFSTMAIKWQWWAAALVAALAAGVLYRPEALLHIPGVGFIPYCLVAGCQGGPLFMYDAYARDEMRTWVRAGDVLLAVAPKSGSNVMMYLSHLVRTRRNLVGAARQPQIMW